MRAPLASAKRWRIPIRDPWVRWTVRIRQALSLGRTFLRGGHGSTESAGGEECHPNCSTRAQRDGLVQEKVKDYLAWLEVKAQLSGQPVDPVRSSMLDSAITGSKKDIVDALRQAYCVVVTRSTDDIVHAFKVTVDPAKPLFTTIKEDPKSRLTDVALAPEAVLPGSGSGFDLWREDEDRVRVKTIVGAFAERPKLLKVLRRKDLLDTVANGCRQGLFVLSLPRPDGSIRTWWRTQIDEAALSDDALEAVQNTAAELQTLDPSLLAPGRLEGLDMPGYPQRWGGK